MLCQKTVSFCQGRANIKAMPGKTCPAQSQRVCDLVFRVLRCSRIALVIHLHPVDVCKRLAVHFVNEQAALQVVHLVLDYACCPPTHLPHHLLSSGVQPWKEVTVWVRTRCTASPTTSSPFPCPWLLLYLQEATSEGNLAALILPGKDASALPSSQPVPNTIRLLGLLWG